MAEDPGLSTPPRTLRSELLRGGSGVFALQITSAVLSVASAVVLARILGPDEFGRYAFAMAVVGVLVLPASLGIPELAVREVAAQSAREQWGPLRGFARWSLRVTTIASMALAVVVGVIVAAIGEGEGRVVLVISLALVPLMGLMRLAAAILRGLRHVVLGHAHETVFRPAAALLFVVVAYAALGGSFDARWAMGAQVAAAFLTVLLAVRLAAVRWPMQARAAAPVVGARGWTLAALPMLLIGTMQVVNANTDIIMLGIIDGSADAGIYRVATRGARLVVLVLIAANAVFQPLIARLYAVGEKERLQRVLTRSVRAVTIVALPIALFLVVFGEPVLRLVFGGDFAAGSTALAVLAASQILNAVAGPGALLLSMTGHERDAAAMAGLGASSNVVFNAILIPPFGIEGAALATGASLVVWNATLVRRCVGRLDTDPTVLGFLRRR